MALETKDTEEKKEFSRANETDISFLSSSGLNNRMSYILVRK
jgi:hypothetical protein